VDIIPIPTRNSLPKYGTGKDYLICEVVNAEPSYVSQILNWAITEMESVLVCLMVENYLPI
jgi:hypothetical protein